MDTEKQPNISPLPAISMDSPNPNRHSDPPTTAPLLATPQPSNRNDSPGPPACAACKHQRRKCAPDCPLAPYFPAHKHKDFLNVYKLYGVGNVVRVLKTVPQHQRHLAVDAITLEANMRATYPVEGCSRWIAMLQERIDLLTCELDLVLKRLAFCKSQQQFATPNSDVHDTVPDIVCTNLTGVGQEFSGVQAPDCVQMTVEENFLTEKSDKEVTETPFECS